MSQASGSIGSGGLNAPAVARPSHGSIATVHHGNEGPDNRRQRRDAQETAEHDLAEHTPAPWLLLDTPGSAQRVLIQHGLDAADRLAWLRTCTAGRDQVFTHAAFLTLEAKHVLDQAQQQHIHQALRRRGTGASKIQAARLCTELAFLDTLHAVAQVQHNVTALDLGNLPLTPDILQEVVLACPNTQQLSLDSIAAHLPPLTADQLPQLAELSMQLVRLDNKSFLIPALRKVCSFTAHTFVVSAEHCLTAILLEPVTSLTAIHLPETSLTLPLIRLFQQRTPSLHTLSVRNVTVSNVRSPGTWRLLHLHIEVTDQWDTSYLAAVAWLPVTVNGTLTVHVQCQGLLLNKGQPSDDDSSDEESSAVHFFNPTDAAMLQRLATMNVVGNAGQTLTICAPVDAITFKVATWQGLICALRPRQVQLQPTLRLTGDELRAMAKVDAVAAITKLTAQWALDAAIPLDDLPCVQGLRVLTLKNCSLSNRVLSVLLHCTPSLEDLTVSGISLAGDGYHGRKWDLDKLTVRDHPGQLTTLAKLAPAGIPEVHMEVGIMCEEVADEELSGLTSQLSNLQLASHLALQPSAILNTTDHPAVLRSTLSALSNVHLHSPTVRLQGWEMSAGLLQTLAGLPAKEQLVFTDCAWPLPLEQYKPLLSLLPHTYSKLEVQGSRAAKVIEAVCQGVLPEGCSVSWHTNNMVQLERGGV